MIEYFLVGKLGASKGTGGFVKMIPHSDFPERFHDLSEVYLDFWGNKKKFFIDKIDFQKRFLLIKFRNFHTQRDIQLLTDREVFVAKEEIVKLPEKYFFIHDLIGSKVFSGIELLGKIKDFLRLPANDVIEIKGSDGSEILIPFVPEFIDSFDPERKVLILKQGIDLNDDED